MTVSELELYLCKLEMRRKEGAYCDKKTYEQAKELSAYLSIAKHGAEPYKQQAVKIISKF